jgi:hypothetical protein
MVEAQDGDAINREREATAVDDRVENGLEGVEAWGVVTRGGGLNRELEDDEGAVDEGSFPDTAFINAAALNGCGGGMVALQIGKGGEGAGAGGVEDGGGRVGGENEVVL